MCPAQTFTKSQYEVYFSVVLNFIFIDFPACISQCGFVYLVSFSIFFINVCSDSSIGNLIS